MKEDLLLELIENSIKRARDVDQTTSYAFRYGWVNSEIEHISRVIDFYKKNREDEK